MAFLGAPSATGTWQLHFGGHHLAVNLTYANGRVAGTTPFFVGVEPTSFTDDDGATVEALAAQSDAIAALAGSLSAKQKTAATLSASFSDVLLGPDKDGQEEGSTWSGFAAMVKLGGSHILEGTDHLPFLLILLLPAPLLAAGGRWRGLVGARAAVRRIGLTTLAFTIGHSLALAISAVTRLDVPAWPVESFIAASILVGAVHAVRPIFPGREAVVAGVFGLGHGMAFSFVLAEMDLSAGRLALSLLGFNVGIELVQLGLVALALPTVVVVARTRFGPAVRIAGATLTGIAAAGWLAARLGFDNVVAGVADNLGSHITPIVVVLAVAAVAAMAGRRVPTIPTIAQVRSGRDRSPRGKAPSASPHR
ncbi:HupE/UreJ family protein [Actinoplanes missouriensis]|uniref:HupE/UreJ family protein n=1 Tax=Actinoplanes missouriensis TaxID=1866 RepID=UPI0036C72EEA